MVKLKLYHFEPGINNLGPGLRAGLWVQGCRHRCHGCLVPETHDPTQGVEVDPINLAKSIGYLENIEGLTISGGEPFDQAEALCLMLNNLMSTNDQLSLMVYTGYGYDQLSKSTNKAVNKILGLVDILVDGPFQSDAACNSPWRGSNNQKIHFLTSRYWVDDYIKAATHRLEFHLNANSLFMSGIPAPDVLSQLERRIFASPFIRPS